MADGVQQFRELCFFGGGRALAFSSTFDVGDKAWSNLLGCGSSPIFEHMDHCWSNQKEFIWRCHPWGGTFEPATWQITVDTVNHIFCSVLKGISSLSPSNFMNSESEVMEDFIIGCKLQVNFHSACELTFT